MFAVMVCSKVLYSTSCSLTESFSYSLHCMCQWTWIQLITKLLSYNVVRIRNLSSLGKHTVYYQAAEYVIRNANSVGSNVHYQAAE